MSIRHLFALVLMPLASIAYAAEPATAPTASPKASTPDPNFASDNDDLAGDHIKLATNIGGFEALPTVEGASKLCATRGSAAVVRRVVNGTAYLRFLSVADAKDFMTRESDKPALDACSGARRVNTYTQYSIKADALNNYDYKRTGVAFGALVVPFKFRLGGAKELVSSATLAPYMGIRTGWLQSWGLTFTPVVASGLSLVPVVDAATKTPTPKAAYTVAFGVRLTSSKNENFSAGLLYGRDFLNKSDRDADPNVTKPWVSFYLGYSM